MCVFSHAWSYLQTLQAAEAGDGEAVNDVLLFFIFIVRARDAALPAWSSSRASGGEHWWGDDGWWRCKRWWCCWGGGRGVSGFPAVLAYMSSGGSGSSSSGGGSSNSGPALALGSRGSRTRFCARLSPPHALPVCAGPPRLFHFLLFHFGSLFPIHKKKRKKRVTTNKKKKKKRNNRPRAEIKVTHTRPRACLCVSACAWMIRESATVWPWTQRAVMPPRTRPRSADPCVLSRSKMAAQTWTGVTSRLWF